MQIGLLAPTYADETYTSDTAADLRTALEIVLHDERNRWPGPGSEFEPEIVEVTFRSGHAQVRLQAEYSIGEPSFSLDVCAPFVGSRMLILLTVFANPAVQTAAVSLNEDTIANLCSIDAKPADYVFTRAEMERYLKEQYLCGAHTHTHINAVCVHRPFLASSRVTSGRNQSPVDHSVWTPRRSKRHKNPPNQGWGIHPGGQ